MIKDKTLSHIKLGERNHIEKPMLSHLDRLGLDMTHLLQDLLTGKMRFTPLLTEPQEAGA